MLTQKNWTTVLHHVTIRSRTLAMGFTVQCINQPATNSQHGWLLGCLDRFHTKSHPWISYSSFLFICSTTSTLEQTWKSAVSQGWLGGGDGGGGGSIQNVHWQGGIYWYRWFKPFQTISPTSLSSCCWRRCRRRFKSILVSSSHTTTHFLSWYCLANL